MASLVEPAPYDSGPLVDPTLSPPKRSLVARALSTADSMSEGPSPPSEAFALTVPFVYVPAFLLLDDQEARADERTK